MFAVHRKCREFQSDKANDTERERAWVLWTQHVLSGAEQKVLQLFVVEKATMRRIIIRNISFKQSMY